MKSRFIFASVGGISNGKIEIMMTKLRVITDSILVLVLVFGLAGFGGLHFAEGSISSA